MEHGRAQFHLHIVLHSATAELVTTETIWPKKTKILSTWPFTEKVCRLQFECEAFVEIRNAFLWGLSLGVKWQGHRYIHVFSFSRHCQDVFQNIHSVLREKLKPGAEAIISVLREAGRITGCLPDPELNKWLETIGTFEWRAKISEFSRFTFLFILTPCTLFKNIVPFNVATLCRNGQEWRSHASVQDPTIETVSFRSHHKSTTTRSPPGSLPELQTKYQEDISNLLLLCCLKFKHIRGQQLRYPHPTSKAATKRLNPGPSRLKSTTQAGHPLSSSPEALRWRWLPSKDTSLESFPHTPASHVK